MVCGVRCAVCRRGIEVDANAAFHSQMSVSEAVERLRSLFAAPSVRSDDIVCFCGHGHGGEGAPLPLPLHPAQPLYHLLQREEEAERAERAAAANGSDAVGVGVRVVSGLGFEEDEPPAGLSSEERTALDYERAVHALLTATAAQRRTLHQQHQHRQQQQQKQQHAQSESQSQPQQSENGSGSGSGSGDWVMTDGAVSLADVWALWVGSGRNRFARLTIVADCCYSGIFSTLLDSSPLTTTRRLPLLSTLLDCPAA